MKRLLCELGFALLVLASTTPPSSAEAKAGSGTIKLKLNYTGAGTVDAKHRIVVLLFDSPDFRDGGVAPVATMLAATKDETLAFTGLTQSRVYAAAVFDPDGEYDGKSGPPPTGASVGLYSKTAGTPEPIKIDPGQTVQITLPFDDSVKMP